METLHIEHKESYAIVVLNNGKVNAISKQMSDELTDAFN